MRPWNEIIAEARDRNKEKAERQRRLKIARSHLKGSDALRRAQGKRKSRLTPDELKLRERDVKVRERHQTTREQEAQRKKEHSAWVIGQATKNAEDRKKKQLKDIKDSPKKAASAALSSIGKPQSISYKDSDATAYTKIAQNVQDLAGGVAKAGIHYLVAKHKAKKAAAELEKKDGGNPPNPPGGGKPPNPPNPPGGGGGGGNPPNPPGGPSRPLLPPGGSGKIKRVSVRDITTEPKRLVPATKRLVPATKRLPPVGGMPQGKPKAKTLGQRARENPKLKAALIAQRNEEFSNWREEFIIEVDDINDKKKKEKIIDVMRGKNKIEINPNIKEERDEEGGMSRNELATVERAAKSLRKKIKSPNQQLPAWVQSKITKAADHLDTVADYMMGETEKVSEAYDDETFRQHSRETFSSHTPSESRSRTAGVLKLMKQMNADVEKPKKKKKKKAVAEECGCEDDKKKVLAMMIIKKAVDAKKKKNFQLNNEIIGEAKTAAWQRKEGKNPTGGLNKKGIASYRREHPGSHLSLAVTTKPSKLDPDSKAAKRRKSFCARMSGMPGPMKDEKGRPTRKALSLRKWNC